MAGAVEAPGAPGAPGAVEAEVQLDRAAFTEVVHLKALRVPTARCQELMKKFSGCGRALRTHARHFDWLYISDKFR